MAMLTYHVSAIAFAILTISAARENVSSVKQGGRCIWCWKTNVCKIFPLLPVCVGPPPSPPRRRPPPPPPSPSCDNAIINRILTKVTRIEEKNCDYPAAIRKSIQTLRDDILREIQNQFYKQQNVINEVDLNTKDIMANVDSNNRNFQVVLQNVDKIFNSLTEIRQEIINKNDGWIISGGHDLDSVHSLVTELSNRVATTSTKQLELLTALQGISLGLEESLRQIASKLLREISKVEWIENQLRTGGSSGGSCNQNEIMRIYQIDQQLLAIVNTIAQQSRNIESMISRQTSVVGSQPTIAAILAVCQGLQTDMTKFSEMVTRNFREYQTQFTKTTTVMESVSRDVKKANEHIVTYANSARALACKTKNEEMETIPGE